MEAKLDLEVFGLFVEAKKENKSYRLGVQVVLLNVLYSNLKKKSFISVHLIVFFTDLRFHFLIKQFLTYK